MSNHPDRQRAQDLPHHRTIEQQTLDALLRIEELLQPRSVTDRGTYEERVTPEATKAQAQTTKKTKGVTRL